MRVKIKEASETESVSFGRIEEIEEGQDLETCFLCNGKPRPELTEDGTDVQYCGEVCKELHFPPDKETAWPIVVKYRSQVGRYILASRDIAAGEIIFTEEALALGPAHDSLPSCLNCLKLSPPDGYLCPKCGLPVCDEMCAEGEEHSKECVILQKLDRQEHVEDYTSPAPIYWCIATLRLLRLRETEPSKYGIIQRMMDHNESHAKHNSWSKYHEHVVKFLREKCGLAGEDYSEEEILHALGVLDVNSVKINSSAGGSSNSGTATGHGLYPLTSLLSHSCISNSKTVLKSDYSVECKATVFIAQGEEITKQYVSPLEPTQIRREKLRNGWYFECRCLRCLDPAECGALTSATRCLRCGEGSILALDPLNENGDAVWQCDNCGFKTTLGAIGKLVDYFLDKLKQPIVVQSVEALEDLLEKSARLLHPNHYVVTLVRIKMNVAYVNLSHRMFGPGGEYADQAEPAEVYMRRKELLDDIHRVIETVEPGLTRRRGLSLFEMSTCHLQLGRLLYESQRFPLDDFIQLLTNEIQSLQEAIECLEGAREGSSEAVIHYKAQCALHEAETMLRLLQQQQR